MKKIVILLLALLCLAGCSAAPAEEAAEAGTIVANAGDWQVELEGNPTTGYEWTWFLEGNNILEETACEYIPEDTSGLRDGAGGLYVFHFAPLAEGEAELHFTYARPWETEAPADSWSVPVSVRQENGELVIYPPGT